MNTPAGGVTLPETFEAVREAIASRNDAARRMATWFMEDAALYQAAKRDFEERDSHAKWLMEQYFARPQEPRAALAGEWRDVRESLPDYEGANEVRQHLVYHPACFGLRIVTEHPSWWNREDPRGREFDGEKVSHWMPLPAAPLPKEPGR